MDSESFVSRSMVLESTPSAIVDVCKWILSRLEVCDFAKDDMFAVHLALEEAFINAVKHGNKMDPAKQVRVEYRESPDKIEIFLTDEGDGFNPEQIPDPRNGDNIYKTNGRGLFLIKSYMDKVEFNKQGNRLHMVRYKDRPDSCQK